MAEHLAMLSEHATVVACAAHDQDKDVRSGIVAKLERHPPSQFLNVPEAHLALRERDAVQRRDHAVPRSLIARDRKCDLGPEREPVAEDDAKVRLEPELGGVTYRRSRGVEADRDLQPDSSCSLGERLDGRRTECSALETPIRRRGHPRSAGDGCLAQAGRRSSITQVAARRLQQATRVGRTGCCWILANAHAMRMRRLA